MTPRTSRSGVRTSRLSKIERGEIRITIDTVAKVAHGLAVGMLDVLTFPEEDDVQRWVDLTRHLSPEQLEVLQRTSKEVPVAELKLSVVDVNCRVERGRGAA
jgi:transcriptional regulator with XRE-family HTH domain